MRVISGETLLLQRALREAVRAPSRAECLAAIRAALEAGANVNARTGAVGPRYTWQQATTMMP